MSKNCVGLYAFKHHGEDYTSLLCFDSDVAAVRAFVLYLYDFQHDQFGIFSHQIDLVSVGSFDIKDGILIGYFDYDDNGMPYQSNHVVMLGSFAIANAFDPLTNKLIEPDILLKEYKEFIEASENWE